MTEHRWSKFWWQDWQRDPALRSCGVAARGLWMDMLAIAFDGAPRGHVTIGGNPATPKQLATIAGITEGACVKLLAELRQAGVFSVTDAGVMFSRRMVRDTEASEAGREAIGKRWRNGHDHNTPPNRGSHSAPHSLEAEADTETEAEKKEPPLTSFGRPPAKSKGTRLPDEWQPKEPDLPSRYGAEPVGTLAHFRDHYAAKAGAGSTMLDWDAAWRSWCRKINDFRRHGGGSTPVKTSQMSVPDQNAELLRLMGRHRQAEDETPPPQLRIVQ